MSEVKRKKLNFLNATQRKNRPTAICCEMRIDMRHSFRAVTRGDLSLHIGVLVSCREQVISTGFFIVLREFFEDCIET